MIGFIISVKRPVSLAFSCDICTCIDFFLRFHPFNIPKLNLTRNENRIVPIISTGKKDFFKGIFQPIYGCSKLPKFCTPIATKMKFRAKIFSQDTQDTFLFTQIKTTPLRDIGTRCTALIFYYYVPTMWGHIISVTFLSYFDQFQWSMTFRFPRRIICD